jgi:transcription initiation factor TFIID TATA-box-binding protein
MDYYGFIIYNCKQVKLINIRNMVFSKDLKRSLNLAKLTLSFGIENVDYEPDDFPGLV